MLVNQHNVVDDVFTLASGDQGVLNQTLVQDTSAFAVDPETLLNQHNVADEVFTLFFWGSRGSETNVSSRHVSTCCRPRHFDEPE